MLPRLFQIGPFTLYSYGLMVVLGFAAGLALAARLASRRGLPGDALIDGSVLFLFAGVAGSRLLFVALNWATYSAKPWDIFALWSGGMSFHGGAIGGVLAGVLYMRHRRIPVLAMADAAAPGLALGYAIGRIGCLLNGCCYGGPTTLPWGMHFPGTDPHLLYHPTQIYASIINLGLCAVLARRYLRPHQVGQIFCAYLGFYSAYRFFIESLRKGVTAEVMAWGLTQAQVFSLVCIVAAGIWWFWLQRNAAPAPELAPISPEPTPAASGA